MLARIAPEILCQTEKIASKTVAMARLGNAVFASDVASPEFCMPISTVKAFAFGMSIFKTLPRPNPQA